MNVANGRFMARACPAVLAVLLLGCWTACHAAYGNRKVHMVSLQLPALPSVDVSDAGKFLNDLMLSPFWKVEKDRGKVFQASARSFGLEWLYRLVREPWRVGRQAKRLPIFIGLILKEWFWCIMHPHHEKKSLHRS